VNENFGFLNFFQKGAKSGDEFRGKFLYESDRVCYQNFGVIKVAREFELMGSGVECREENVFGHDSCAG